MKGNYGNIIIKFVVNGSRKFPLLMQMIMYRCAIEQLACILKRPFGLTRKLGENPGQSVLGGMQHQAGFQSGCPPARPDGRLADWPPTAVRPTGPSPRSAPGPPPYCENGESDDDLVALAPSLSHKYL